MGFETITNGIYENNGLLLFPRSSRELDLAIHVRQEYWRTMKKGAGASISDQSSITGLVNEFFQR